MRVCKSCCEPKAVECFGKRKLSADGIHLYCKECVNRDSAERYKQNRDSRLARHRQYAAENREAVYARQVKWRKENPDKARAIQERHYRLHPDRVRQLTAARGAKRYRAHKHSPDFALRLRVGNQIRKRLMSGAGGGFSLLDYSPAELRAHLERQFTRGMTWDNYGEWHIDHIVPLASFTITGPDDPELRRAWALPNLRPLWATDNLRKGARRLSLL